MRELLRYERAVRYACDRRHPVATLAAALAHNAGPASDWAGVLHLGTDRTGWAYGYAEPGTLGRCCGECAQGAIAGAASRIEVAP